MKKIFFIFALMGILMNSCSSDTEDLISNTLPFPTRIFKLNGDYVHNVPVVLDSTRSEVLYRPDVESAQIRDDKKCVFSLIDGYYTVHGMPTEKNVGFVTWTFEEYANFTSTPSKEEFFKHLIPEARIIELYEYRRLEPAYNSGNERLQFLNEIINKGFPDCKLIYKEE